MSEHDPRERRDDVEAAHEEEALESSLEQPPPTPNRRADEE